MRWQATDRVHEVSTSAGSTPRQRSRMPRRSALVNADALRVAPVDHTGRMMIDAVRSLGRSTAWELVDEVAVRGDVGHPQGLCRWGDDWLVSTVHPGSGTGELLVVAADGEVVRRVDVTDGERFHPGGFAFDPTAVEADARSPGCWIAVAEYRPRSTTTVMRLDTDLVTVESFPFDDHLGAICPLGDGTLFAVSWASRRWYRLDTAGHILEQRTTPSRWVDLQDIVHVSSGIDGERVVATGVGGVVAPAGPMQLGGLVVIDVDAMTIAHDTPITAWMPSGRVATYNGAHLDVDADLDAESSVTLHCLVDDTTATIGMWTAQTRTT